jgi:hypothetical protein
LEGFDVLFEADELLNPSLVFVFLLSCCTSIDTLFH